MNLSEVQIWWCNVTYIYILVVTILNQEDQFQITHLQTDPKILISQLNLFLLTLMTPHKGPY